MPTGSSWGKFTPEEAKTVYLQPDWAEKFDNQFWLHRVLRRTKQSKDIKDFIRETIRAHDAELVKHLIQRAKYSQETAYKEGLNAAIGLIKGE